MFLTLLAIMNGSVREITYQNGPAVFVSIFGCIIGLLVVALGVFVLVKIKIKQVSNIKFKGFVAKNVTQGVVLAIVGAIIVVFSVSHYPTKQKDLKIEGKEIVIEKNKSGEIMHMAK